MVRASLRPEAVPPDPDGDLRRAGRAPSPSPDTQYGRSGPRGRRPDHTGLARASRSARRSRTRSRTRARSTRSGSVFDFVLLHQTVIGQESIEQMEMAGEEPDVIIGCAGGGSNFAGLTFPWLGQDVPRRARVPRDRRRARGGAVTDPRRLHVRLRRHGEDDAAGQDAHPRPRLHPRADPRRRPALPRHVAARVACSRRTATSRRGRSTSARASRPACSSRAPRASCPAPEPTHAIRVAIDEALAREGGRRVAGDPVQPVRPRPLRPGGLREVPDRHARGLRVPGRERSRRRWPACPMR